jgi:polyisoprenoid-binding protein YceI
MTATTTEFTEFAVLTGEYTFDPNHTRLGFVARHAMVTKVRGSFNTFTGTINIDGEHPENSGVRVTVEVDSVDTRNEMRDNHLRSNDFLDIANYPHLTFASTEIKHLGGNDFEVTGELTIKGVTRTVTVPVEYQGSATDPFGNQRIGFEGSTVINRTDFGVTYNAALETGGVLVGDKITLEFEVSAIKTA